MGNNNLDSKFQVFSKIKNCIKYTLTHDNTDG